MQSLIYAVLALAGLTACNPTFNWRDVRPEDTRLSLLMPCKPDKAQKTVPMGGQPTALLLLSCDAAGVTFAVAVADVKDASLVKDALVQWQGASLASRSAARQLILPRVRRFFRRRSMPTSLPPMWPTLFFQD